MVRNLQTFSVSLLTALLMNNEYVMSYCGMLFLFESFER